MSQLHQKCSDAALARGSDDTVAMNFCFWLQSAFAMAHDSDVINNLLGQYGVAASGTTVRSDLRILHIADSR